MSVFVSETDLYLIKDGWTIEVSIGYSKKQYYETSYYFETETAAHQLQYMH